MKPSDFHSRLTPFALGVCLLLGLAWGRTARATDPLYQNFANLNYVIPGSPPPIIDGKNYLTPAFDNENVFNVTFAAFTANPEYYEAWNMLYYTNNGIMLADSSFSTQGQFVIGFSPGCGFIFDLQTTNVISHQPADTFYNANTIHCNSLLDPNTALVSLLGQCVVSATNIFNPGWIEVGPDGLIQFAGRNVDLSRGVMTVEALQDFFTGFANINPIGTIGVDTNAEWDPSIDLGPNFALSSWSGGAPFPGGFFVQAFPATDYLQVLSPDNGTNIIWRAVFIQNSSPNAPYQVFVNGAGLGLGSGEVNIEWAGSYVDPATGDTVTHYLYLNNDYVLGAGTNVALIGGLPSNFTFTESASPLFAGSPASFGFSGYPAGTLSNRFAFVNAQFIPTSVPTNATVSNPSGALTNLPGRVQISAGGHLDLALSQITGANYLSLQSPNQFDGNAGAKIVSAFSDIHLGVTNGFLTFTNLVPQSIPTWSGTVQAWSTRFLTTFTNSSITFSNGVPVGTNVWQATNDFRVLIVNSQLVPTSQPQVQDLILHDTNSLVLSDVMNVMRTLSIDAQSLTLTTNVIGVGASSLDGELNVHNNNILWPSALPNLRWLTNWGAIRLGNLAVFGGPAPANYGAFINHGLLVDQGSTIYADNFLNSGIISNGVGSFILQSRTATMTNGAIVAGANISISADSLEVSNAMWQAGRGLTLQVTNLLTDDGVTNGNVWTLGGTSLVGLTLPFLPNNPTNRGDLLGTTISVGSPLPNKQTVNTWAGQDRGTANAGYTNNVAIGVLTLDAQGVSSAFTFNGTGTSNALYVDELKLLDYASYTNHDTSGNLRGLSFSNNIVLYYAQAITADGASVAEKINHKNNDHLRWVFSYAGHFSGTNIVYPDGTTNGPYNTALAQSSDIDSDGDGLVNGSDPTPFLKSSMVVITYTQTNIVTDGITNSALMLTWNSIPLATNFVLYSTTNAGGPFDQLLTNFVSPIPYPSPPTNVSTIDMNPSGRFYRVRIDPWLTYPF